MQQTSSTPKRGRPSATERNQRREVILNVAVSLLIEHGYARTTMEQIAHGAQVTKRTIYTYFGDKSDVFAAAVERLHSEVASGTHAGRSPEALVELAVRIVRTLHAADAIGLHRLVIAEATQFPELAATFYSTGPQRYIDLLAQHLADDEPAAHAEVLFTLLLGEPHRKRLLGLAAPPSAAEASRHAHEALTALGIDRLAH